MTMGKKKKRRKDSLSEAGEDRPDPERGDIEKGIDLARGPFPGIPETVEALQLGLIAVITADLATGDGEDRPESERGDVGKGINVARGPSPGIPGAVEALPLGSIVAITADLATEAGEDQPDSERGDIGKGIDLAPGRSSMTVEAPQLGSMTSLMGPIEAVLEAEEAVEDAKCPDCPYTNIYPRLLHCHVRMVPYKIPYRKRPQSADRSRKAGNGKIYEEDNTLPKSQGRDSPIFLQFFYLFSIFFLNRF
jgi:hypothetical protein